MVFSRLFKFVLLLILMVSLGFSQVVLPKFGLTPAGNGARAAGMGYAFTAIADDATAIAWNPAGLSQLYAMELGLVARFGTGSETVQYAGTEYDINRGSNFDLNFASFVFPFEAGNFHMAAGVAYRTLYDFNQEQDLSEILKATGLGDQWVETFTGGIRAISPSVAFALNDMFSFGATMNFITGSTNFKLESDYFTEEDGDTDFSGTNFELGVLAQINEMFTLGAMFTSGYDLTAEEDGFEMVFEIPTAFKLGAAIRPSDNLTIGLDYHVMPLSGTSVIFDGGEPVEDFFDHDANTFHIGLEYIAGNMPLRFGYYQAPTVFVDVNDDQVAYNAATFGIGFILGSVVIDFSGEYIFGSYEDSDWSGSGDTYDSGLSEFRFNLGAVIHLGE